jgi:hypothetical protein
MMNRYLETGLKNSDIQGDAVRRSESAEEENKFSMTAP